MALASSSDHHPRPMEAARTIRLVLQVRDEALTQAIGDHGNDQQNANNDSLEIGLHAGNVHAVLDEPYEDGSENYVAQPARAAAQTDASYDAGGNRIEWHGRADIGLARRQAGRQHDARCRG